MRKFAFLVLFLALFSLVLISCKPKTDTTPDGTTEVYTGTKGLEMSFVKNQPPSKIYDKDSLNILLELKNLGASDLSGSKCRLFISGYSNSIVRMSDNDMDCGNLEGKTIYNPEGSYETVEFKAASMELPENMDTMSQNFLVEACYEYQTTANPVVCIDPRIYDLTTTEKACTVKDVTLSGGQGAPVAVTGVKVNMMKSRVQFKINVANLGKGTVLSQGTSIFQDCPYNLQFYDYNLIDYEVDMSGATLESCSPQIDGGQRMRLVDNKGMIICTFQINDDTTYSTPLSINLYYNYLDSVSKKVEIVKTPE